MDQHQSAAGPTQAAAGATTVWNADLLLAVLHVFIALLW